MRCPSALPLCLLLVLAAGGCSHHSAPSDHASEEELQAWVAYEKESQRAFEQERQADLVIEYNGVDEIWLIRPGQRPFLPATESSLGAAIARATPARRLAVVIISKFVRHALSESQLRDKVDELEAIVKAKGFKRVVFQLYSGSGRPIYRE